MSMPFIQSVKCCTDVFNYPADNERIDVNRLTPMKGTLMKFNQLIENSDPWIKVKNLCNLFGFSSRSCSTAIKSIKIRVAGHCSGTLCQKTGLNPLLSAESQKRPLQIKGHALQQKTFNLQGTYCRTSPLGTPRSLLQLKLNARGIITQCKKKKIHLEQKCIYVGSGAGVLFCASK